MANKLDRITLGDIINLSEDKNLKKEGKACFKLRIAKKEYYEFSDKTIKDYNLVGKLSSGGKFLDKYIGYKEFTRQRFLAEVNNRLEFMNSYLSEARYSNSIFGLPKVTGILYKELVKNINENK